MMNFKSEFRIQTNQFYLLCMLYVVNLTSGLQPRVSMMTKEMGWE